ncbi:copper amine oxidase N-terminal domain-containing protein [Natranaerofaba carboxydovora]|uniref:copper amine oxidase N-terminal domain-containing protein n=1 Tax=Natranaerofaba carboxydovora TaxID=2742683 RepID=UPI001F1459CF|nr:copper amine oxidase N-terminal domain-containing protein [Natranaerofaba carboxydovora]UMZ74649.1 hypothetical protein ACONDI_02248 [Natranaerofaba carboxydovora]
MKKAVLVLISILLIGAAVGSVVAIEDSKEKLENELENLDLNLEQKLVYFEELYEKGPDGIDLEAVIDDLIDEHSEALAEVDELEGVESYEDLRDRLDELNVRLNMDVVLDSIDNFDLSTLDQLKTTYGLSTDYIIFIVDEAREFYEGLRDDEVVEDLKEIFEITGEDVNEVFDSVMDRLIRRQNIEKRVSEVEEILQNPDLIAERREMELNEKIYVYGERLNFEDTTDPVITNDRTILSVRAIAEALGADVSWDHDTRTVTIERHMTTIELPIGEKQVSIIENGEERVEELDVAAEIKNDRTMVPLRFVSEVLGESVKWYEETGEIDIGLK